MKAIYTTLFCMLILQCGAQSICGNYYSLALANNAFINNQEPSENFTYWGGQLYKKAIYYYFDTGTDDMPGNDEFLEIKKAFSIWEAAANFKFFEVCSWDKADIKFEWTNTYDGPGNSDAYTTEISRWIYMDDSKYWSKEGVFSVLAFALHEIGHALGLGHNNTQSVMTPIVSPFYKQLYQDDINGIQSLYGPPDPDIWNLIGPSQFCPNAVYSINSPPWPYFSKTKWSVSGPAVISGPDTLKTVTINATGSGIAELKAAITYGCETKTISKSITSAYTATLNGPDKYCNTASYQVSGLPANALVTWTTNGAVQIVGSNTANPVTVGKLYDGTGTLNANITSNCQNKTISKSIVLGLPTPTLSAVNYSPWGSYNDFGFTASPYIAGFTYNWYVNGILEESGPNNFFEWYTPCGHSAAITCKIMNACGISASSTSFHMSGICDKWTASLVDTYPNPAGNELKITLKQLSILLDSETTSIPLDIRLVNSNGKILLSGQLSEIQTVLVMDTSRLSDGIYYLQVQQGSSISKQEVIIKH